MPLDALSLRYVEINQKTKKAIPEGTAFKRGREEGKLREGDARRRSDKRNVRIGQVDISGKGLQSSVSMASFVDDERSTCSSKAAPDFLWKEVSCC
jgi:hypothetical protein